MVPLAISIGVSIKTQEIESDPLAPIANYYRPDGASAYLRPDGSSYYVRP